MFKAERPFFLEMLGSTVPWPPRAGRDWALVLCVGRITKWIRGTIRQFEGVYKRWKIASICNKDRKISS